MESVFQRCIIPSCGGTSAADDTSFACPKCGGLMDVVYDWNRLPPPKSLREFEAKWSERTNPLSFSGVWRFRDLLPFAPPDKVMTIGEGQTILQKADIVAGYVGMDAGKLFLQGESHYELVFLRPGEGTGLTFYNSRPLRPASSTRVNMPRRIR